MICNNSRLSDKIQITDYYLNVAIKDHMLHIHTGALIYNDHILCFWFWVRFKVTEVLMDCIKLENLGKIGRW